MKKRITLFLAIVAALVALVLPASGSAWGGGEWYEWHYCDSNSWLTTVYGIDGSDHACYFTNWGGWNETCWAGDTPEYYKNTYCDDQTFRWSP